MNKPYLIAEIGINHNGDLEIAKRLIDHAVKAKFDAVKFQKRDIELVYDKKLLDSPRESPWGTTQREQKEGLEFSKKEYDYINEYCSKQNIDIGGDIKYIQSKDMGKIDDYYDPGF